METDLQLDPPTTLHSFVHSLLRPLVFVVIVLGREEGEGRVHFSFYIPIVFLSIFVPRIDSNPSLLLCRVDKKRDKLDRQVLDSQERAFWDVHRPAVSRVLNY